MAFTSAKMAELLPRHRIEVTNYHFELHNTLSELAIEAKEKTSQEGIQLLQQLHMVIERAPDTVETGPWKEQSQKAIDQFTKKKSIIGIVGGTGAGKTSFINALLEEESLLPTNCMRACTATITEISYNKGKAKYRAIIEFLTRDEWRDELEKGLAVLFDETGRIVKDATNEDSEAGVFYSKIRAIYSDLTREAIEHSTVESLLAHKEVQVLDRKEEFEDNDSTKFAKKLQRVIDSKDRGHRGSSRDIAYWPIIKRVQLRVRAKALSTGVTLVDLPGIQDSTPARAKVAENYMKSCTGLIVTAPIHRAKDDRVAKNLLGPTFRRQLMMDGGYSTMTFACTKIDEINIQEMCNTVEPIRRQLEKISLSIENKRRECATIEAQIQDSMPQLSEAEDALLKSSARCDVLEDIARETEGELGRFILNDNNKRQAIDSPNGINPASNKRRAGTQGIIEDERDEDDQAETEDRDQVPDASLSLANIDYERSFSQARNLRDAAKATKEKMLAEIKDMKSQLIEIEGSIRQLEDEKRSTCIRYRNDYVVKAIKADFVAGVRESDQERAQYDEDYDPTVETRDYEKLADDLSVFAVSSRAYQKKMGKMRHETEIPGFATLEDTGMPAALRHCEQLTQTGRRKNADFFLAMLSKLLNSINLWLANQINSCKVSDMHREQARLLLQDRLATLKNSFAKLVRHAVDEVARRVRETVYKSMVVAKTVAARESQMTVANWAKHSHGTWKAICRRDGVFANENINCDWNNDLSAPLVAALAPQWEQAFSTDLEQIFTDFAARSRKKIKEFHASVPELLSPFGINARHSYKRLEGQHTGYKQAFAEAEDIACEFINSQQREINRVFKPLVCDAMRPAYTSCVAITGAGCFIKMRAYMKDYMEKNQHMFRDVTKAVQKQLDRMLLQVKENLTTEVNKIHVEIVKDYTETLCGDGGKDGEDYKTDATDVFVNQISYFLEQSKRTFQRGKDEHDRRLNKFGSVFAADRPMQPPPKTTQPTIVVDDDDEEDIRGDNLHRNAFSVRQTPRTDRSSKLPTAKDDAHPLSPFRARQRERYSRPPTTTDPVRFGPGFGGVDLNLVKEEPKEDDPALANSPVLPSIEGGERSKRDSGAGYHAQYGGSSGFGSVGFGGIRGGAGSDGEEDAESLFVEG